MDQLLLQNHRAQEAAIWPLGKTTDDYEPPLWQEICRGWVETRMKPVHVTHLIEELLDHADVDSEETTARDIRDAIKRSGDWEAVLERLGWQETESVIDGIDEGDTLARVVNLAITGSALDAPDPDCRLYWVRNSPTWVSGATVMKPELIPWRDMLESNIGQREADDAQRRLKTHHDTAYELCVAMPSMVRENFLFFSGYKAGIHPKDAKTVDELPEEIFGSSEDVFTQCRSAITKWVIKEWLEPHGFVNLDSNEWSSEVEWCDLGETEGVEEEVTRNEIAHWYLVSEDAADHLRAVGEVVADLHCSSYSVWGRDQGGQAIQLDGAVVNAMTRSGYLNHAPALGALNRDEARLPRGLRVTLGGEEYPFRIEGYSMTVSRSELEAAIVDTGYREAGWGVVWGPEFESDMLGSVKTFKICPVQEQSDES